MAQPRAKLKAILKGFTDNVYYQAPTKLSYPCIIYSLAGIDTRHADDMKYSTKKRYIIKVIDKDPDSKIVDDVLGMPYTTMEPRFVKDNLYQTPFTTYF